MAVLGFCTKRCHWDLPKNQVTLLATKKALMTTLKLPELFAVITALNSVVIKGTLAGSSNHKNTSS